MADKAELKIVLSTVDKWTAGINAFNKRIDELTRPTREFGKALSDLAEKSGLNAVTDRFRAVRGAVMDLVGKAALVGGAVGVAVAGVLSLVDHFDALGDTADRLGTSADFLAAFRYAAERAGAPLEGVDSALQTLVTNMGAAKSGTGKMLKFLNQISPAFARQVTAANSLEEALGLLADATAKIPDAARRSKLAAATLGDPALAPLLAKGAAGVQELLTEYHGLAGAQGEAATAAGATDDALKKMHAATDGVKAALVTGLAPALTTIIDKISAWLVGHRGDVEQWARDLGEKLPAGVNTLLGWIDKASTKVTTFVDAIGGWNVAAAGLAAVIAGPLVASVAALGVALLTTPFGQVLLALTPIVAAIGSLVSETEAFEAVAQRLGFVEKKKTPEQQFQSDMDAMMEDGRRAAKSEAAAKAALDANPAVQAQRLWQDQQDAMLAIPPTVNPKLESMREGLAHRSRMADLEAQIAQFSAQHPGPQEVAQFSAQHPGPQEVKIKVDIANAPRGTRVTADAKNATVDMTTGYQMGGF